MPGGLFQLLAHGAQDVYLTGNPQITFFETVVPYKPQKIVEGFGLEQGVTEVRLYKVIHHSNNFFY